MTWYFLVALIDLYFDAGICIACKRKFNIKLGAISALAWPVTMPVLIIIAAIETKNYKSFFEE